MRTILEEKERLRKEKEKAKKKQENKKDKSVDKAKRSLKVDVNLTKDEDTDGTPVSPGGLLSWRRSTFTSPMSASMAQMFTFSLTSFCL